MPGRCPGRRSTAASRQKPPVTQKQPQLGILRKRTPAGAVFCTRGSAPPRVIPQVHLLNMLFQPLLHLLQAAVVPSPPPRQPWAQLLPAQKHRCCPQAHPGQVSDQVPPDSPARPAEKFPPHLQLGTVGDLVDTCCGRQRHRQRHPWVSSPPLLDTKCN